MGDFMTNQEMMKTYGIKQTKLRSHKLAIFKMYDIDPKRLPKQGVLPTKVVKDYFKTDYEKKDA